MRTIFEVAEILELDDHQFRELIDDGKLDGVKLDNDCLSRVRKAFLDATTEVSETAIRAAFAAAARTRH